VIANDALTVFLRDTLGSKRDRILDFVSRDKAHPKFLDLLYHTLGGLFRRTCVVDTLPDAAWNAPAYRFRPPKEFGTPVQTLRAAYRACGQNELVITNDGRYGYWRDETYADAETLVVAKPTHSPHR